MRGYNKNRTCKQSERATKAKVLSAWNGKAWVRVSSKSLDFYCKNAGVTHQKQVNDHRIEYFNSDNRCVLVYEF